MRLVEIDAKMALDFTNTVADMFRFGKAGAKSKMDIAKANPPKDNKTRHTPTRRNKCGKWDDPKTTGCVR